MNASDQVRCSDHDHESIAAIRERDAAFGKDIPTHWQGPRDRRALLAELDRLLETALADRNEA